MRVVEGKGRGGLLNSLVVREVGFKPNWYSKAKQVTVLDGLSPAEAVIDQRMSAPAPWSLVLRPNDPTTCEARYTAQEPDAHRPSRSHWFN